MSKDRVNLLKTTPKKAQYMTLPARLWRWLPYIAIPLAIFLGMTAWSQRGTITRMEKRIGSLEESNTAHILEQIKQLRDQMSKVEKLQGVKREESKIIKIDIGKTIKEFNSDIKDTKKIDNAADSASALSDVWSK